MCRTPTTYGRLRTSLMGLRQDWKEREEEDRLCVGKLQNLEDLWNPNPKRTWNLRTPSWVSAQEPGLGFPAQPGTET